MSTEKEIRMLDIRVDGTEAVHIQISDGKLWLNIDGVCRMRIIGQNHFQRAPDDGSTHQFTIEDNRPIRSRS